MRLELRHRHSLGLFRSVPKSCGLFDLDEVHNLWALFERAIIVRPTGGLGLPPEK